MRIDKIISDLYVGKVLIGTEFNDYEDSEYWESINEEPAILPSVIKEAFVNKDADGDFMLSFTLENGTTATVYANEEVYLREY